VRYVLRSEEGLSPPQFTKGCGERRKLPGEPLTVFLFIGSMKHILGHKNAKILDS